MKIAVIGTGYVGLVAGACFADTGNNVICVDIDQKKTEALKRGEIPIFEPGLETLVRRGAQEGRLHFTTSTREAVEQAEIIFMAVGTPPLPDGNPNLSYLKNAAEEIGRCMNGYKVIVNKSTVPIGSHETVASWITPFTKHPFDVVSNPEFLKEGTAVEDFLKPDRVVIGTLKKEAYQIMAELYSPFVRNGNPVFWMDPISAEITKYACNSFLATRISFMNELSRLCEGVGGNIEEVRRGMASDVRIGKHFLYAGVGYGGSCFPKDVQALLSTGRQNEVHLEIINAAERANAKQKIHFFDRIENHFGNLKGKTLAIWGLAFKPNTDDIREAPALVIIEALLKKGAIVRVFDPVAMDNAKQELPASVQFCKTAYDTLDGADALAILTEWNEFRHPDFKRMKSLLKTPVLFDGRNLFEPAAMKEKGFHYLSVGRPTA